MVVLKQTLTPTTKFQTIPTRTKQIIKETEDLDLSIHPVRPVVEVAIPQRIVILEQTQRTDRLTGIDDREEKTNPNREMLKATQMGMSKLQPKFLHQKRHVFTPELHVTDRRQMKHQNFHQFPRLSGSNPRRQVQIKLT